MRSRVLVPALLLIGGLLAGFLPEYVRAERLESQLRAATTRNRQADLRDLAALLYVQASQQNYGLARQTASEYFNRAKDVPTLSEVTSQRDAITGALAKADSSVVGRLQELYLRTRAATQ